MPWHSRGRRAAIWTISLGVLLAVVATLAIWVERLALDTDNYVETTTDVLESEDVQVVLSNFIVNQLYANVDVEAEIRNRLPGLRARTSLADPARYRLQMTRRSTAPRPALPPI